MWDRGGYGGFERELVCKGSICVGSNEEEARGLELLLLLK